MITWLKIGSEKKIADYKAFLFDFDDTLVDYDLNENNALRQLSEDLNIPTDHYLGFRERYQEINKSHWKAYREKKISASEIGPSRFKVLSQYFAQITNPESTNKTYLKYFCKYVSAYKGSIEFLKLLQEHGKKSFILTNGFTQTQRQRIEVSGFTHLIDGFLTSQMVGIAKPDPKIILDALEILEVGKDEVLFVGDKIDSDLKAAHFASIDSFHITGTPREYDKFSPIGYSSHISFLYEHYQSLTSQ